MSQLGFRSLDRHPILPTIQGQSLLTILSTAFRRHVPEPERVSHYR